MNLVIVSYQDIYAANGSAKFVRQFEEANQEEIGFTVQIYANGRKEQKQGKKKSFITKIKSMVHQFLSDTYIGNIVDIYLRYMQNAKKVIKRLKKEECKWSNPQTVILFNDIFVLYYFSKLIGFNGKRCALVFHNDGHCFKMLGLNYPKCKKLFSKLENKKILLNELCKLQRIVFVSEMARKTFLELYPQFENIAETIYIGIAGSRERRKAASTRDEGLRLVSVGTINHRKNQLGIIKALLSIEDSSIKLTLVGDGDEYGLCQDFLRKNQKLAGRVNLAGERRNVSDYLRDADVFVSFSYDEGLPIAAQEALANGLPLILTNVGGCKELIHENGLLINPMQEELISAIETINKNRDKLHLLSEKSRQLYLEKFSIEVMFKNYKKLIQDIWKEM